jgi:hypothetical protein
MQKTQKLATAEGAVWLSIISSAPGKQGYKTGAEANDWKTAQDAAPTAIVLDPAGDMGRTFAAKTTPHMYIIDEAQTLVYQGAIDDNRSANPATVAGAKNYVLAAMDDLKAGNAVGESDTAPYGCSVKYGSYSEPSLVADIKLAHDALLPPLWQQGFLLRYIQDVLKAARKRRHPCPSINLQTAPFILPS